MSHPLIPPSLLLKNISTDNKYGYARLTNIAFISFCAANISNIVWFKMPYTAGLMLNIFISDKRLDLGFFQQQFVKSNQVCNK